MKAAVLTTQPAIQIKEVQRPQIKAGEVLVAAELAGICGSDGSIFHGKYDKPCPIIPGHEAVDRVLATGSVANRFEFGQRVTIHPNYSCGECALYQQGLRNICSANRTIAVRADLPGAVTDNA
ncbi:alcohol dehydrogenase catalytic domain-containing protein [Pelobacter seleniigenes]|uniref:alcohol dehydrogenase catalytic domain-containing protein n=1 Tax=Pelobacter seleniigenes TaxID=407188 RepID=UPI0004A71AEB|nr:alcohol dehydrogenase catalytic domain-containing protein [Pelobacter seleniigenes]